MISGLRSSVGAGGLDVLFEVDEDVHVVLQQLRRQADGIGWSDRAVGPHFESQLVVIGDLSQTSGFHGVVALAHRRVHRVDGNEADAQVFVEVLVGGNVAAAALEAHFHVELAAFADGGDVDVLIENFDIGVGFDHAGGHYAGLIGAQVDGLGRVAAQLEGNLLQVEDDVGGVFDHAGNRLEFVQHAFDFDRGDGRAFDGAQQHAAKRVADGGAEAAFKRLRPEDAVLVGEGCGVNCETFGFLKTLPKHLLFSFGRLAQSWHP